MEYNPFTLAGKTLLITGASAGIGRAIAIECSKLGASLVITGRNEKRLMTTFSFLYGKGHQQYLADLTNYEAVIQFVEKLPALSGVVLNAGIILPKPFVFQKKEEIMKLLNINFFGSLDLLQQIIKTKKLVKPASVVFVSSIAGNKITIFGSSIYGASKSAVNGLSKGLALEFAGKGIRVNTVMPGMIETDIMKGSSISPEDLEADKLRYPLKRYGRPEEVAYAVIYLLSDASAWVTGTDLLIDGGFTLQ